MKSVFMTLVLSAATSALAAPTSSLKPLELTNLNAGIYYTDMPTTCLFSFSLNDPNTNTNTTCSGYWSVGMAGDKTYDCSDKAYQLHLPNGIYNIEDFDLGVIRVGISATGLSATGQSTVKGESWKCEKQESPMEQCKWDGVFSIDLAPSS